MLPIRVAQLAQVMHQLGGWPSGLWQRVDEGAEPYGELLQVLID